MKVRQATGAFYLLVLSIIAVGSLGAQWVGYLHTPATISSIAPFIEPFVQLVLIIIAVEIVSLRIRPSVSITLALPVALISPLLIRTPFAGSAVAIGLGIYYASAFKIHSDKFSAEPERNRALSHVAIMVIASAVTSLFVTPAWLAFVALPQQASPTDIALFLQLFTPAALAALLEDTAWILSTDDPLRFMPFLVRLSTSCTLALVGLGYAIVWNASLPLALVLPLAASTMKALSTPAYSSMTEAEALTVAQRARALEVVLTASQQLTIDDDPFTLLHPVASAAQEVTGADDVAMYAATDRAPNDLRLLFALPLKVAPPPEQVYLSAGGSTLLHAGAGIYLVPIGRTSMGRPRACLRIAGAVIKNGSETHHTLTVLASQTAVALENADIHRRALTQANEDGLTHLMNHRTFQIRLQEEVSRARRAGLPLALVMIDLDNFSGINNTYGHPGGDAALLAVADVLRATVRQGDIPVRYAGDEFAVILPNAEPMTARVTGERICAAICAIQVKMDASTQFPVGCSVGLANLSPTIATREELIRQADLAAYAAKRLGKGQVAGEQEVLALPDLSENPYEKQKIV